jgi:transcriptional regulator NrdR family protein
MSGIRCPVCLSTENNVVDSRPADDHIRRRRVCNCGHRWSTFETTYRTDALVAQIRQLAELTGVAALPKLERPRKKRRVYRPPVLKVKPASEPVAAPARSVGITLAKVSILEAAE